MEPCPFVRLVIESMALKLPPSYPTSAAPCFCKLKIKNFPSQTVLLPFCLTPEDDSSSPISTACASASFHLDSTALSRLSGKAVTLRVSVYASVTDHTCWATTTRKFFLGRATVIIDFSGGAAETNPSVFQDGWVNLRDGQYQPSAKLHLVVRSKPDRRFVFQFGGEPECSPVVFHIQGNIRQPVFSCIFSINRDLISPPLPLPLPKNNRRGGWIRRILCSGGERVRQGRGRKGWTVTIHDLTGSPVAIASMRIPFVPSPGSNRVSRSSPGVWFIYKPNGDKWEPWGRLEAWREKGPVVDSLGYKFERFVNNTRPGPTSSSERGTPIAEAILSVKKGGKVSIDSTSRVGLMRRNGAVYHSRQSIAVKGFLMGSTVESEGKVSEPPMVEVGDQVGVRHATRMANAALYIALSAAIDLSMDACRLFPSKLRKELRQPCCTRSSLQHSELVLL